MGPTTLRDTVSDVSRRRLPIQIANESRMISATVALLADHPVAAITSRMIAEESGTATNYISRYFGGRDGLFLAVADELSHRVTDMVRSERSVIEFDRPGNYVTRIMELPEVAMWFKVYRYLAGRGLPVIPIADKAPLVGVMEDAISLIFGLDGPYVPVLANLFLTFIMGHAAFGAFLGSTDDDAQKSVTAMATFASMLVETGRLDTAS